MASTASQSRIKHEKAKAALSLLRKEVVAPKGKVEEDTEMLELLRLEFKRLPSRPREVLSLLWGLNGRERSLREVGRRFGLTRERVRQLEAAALSKLRWRIEVRWSALRREAEVRTERRVAHG